MTKKTLCCQKRTLTRSRRNYFNKISRLITTFLRVIVKKDEQHSHFQSPDPNIPSTTRPSTVPYNVERGHSPSLLHKGRCRLPLVDVRKGSGGLSFKLSEASTRNSKMRLSEFCQERVDECTGRREERMFD